MKKTVLLLAATAAFLALSCQKEMEVTESVDDNAFALKASIEDLSTPTKATINGSHQFLWSASDKIGVYVSDWGTKNQPFTLSGAGGERTGSFVYDYDGGVFSATTATAAYFPWNGTNIETDNNVSGSTMYFKLKQGYDNYLSGQMLTPLVSPMTYSAGSYAPITFKHAGAAVKVVVSNVPAGAHSMGLVAEGQQIRGGYHTDFNCSSNLVLDGDANLSYNDVWLNFTPANSERPYTFIFPVPSLGENVKLTFQLYDKNDVLVWRRSVSAHDALNRGDILLLNGDAAVSVEPYRQLSSVSAEWGICGTHNSWSGDTEMMTDGESCVVKGLALAADAEFKIRKDGAWAESYGASALKDSYTYTETGSDGNIKINTAGEYDIIFNIDNKKVYVVPTGECPYPASAHHYSSIKSATELGTTETANCYVITAAGSYKIPVVKGNSSTSAGTVGGVELLWETYNNGTTVTANSVIEAVDWDERETGYIFFKTPDVLQPGNALIAAKDADGNIIWSWHIWIPATAITDIGEYAVSSKYYMDRNLGALRVASASSTTDVDAESFGMFFQWGRKDPFIGPRELRSTSLARINGTAIDRTTDTGFDLESSIAHPTTFANFNEWNSGYDNLWGQGESKTIHDPCPAGYRIPEYNESEVLWQDAVSNGTFVANGAHGWWKVGSSFVFPMAGECTGTSVSHVFDRSKVWTAKQLDNSHPQHGTAQYIYYENGDPDTWTDAEDGAWASVPGWGNRKRYGSSVRCQRIEGQVEAPIPVGATSITLDGNFSDWAGAEAIPNGSKSIREWKYGSDSENLYFYFKIIRTDIIASQDYTEGLGYAFDWRRYIYLGIDTDNNSSTGASVTSGSLSIDGCEVKGLVYPFRGYSTSASGTDGSTVLNGQDSQGSIQYPVGTSVGNITVWGSIDETYGYLEIGIPRSLIGSPSAGKMNVQFSLSSNITGQQKINITN